MSNQLFVTPDGTIEKKKCQLFINMDKEDIPFEEYEADGRTPLPPDKQSDPRYVPFWKEEKRKIKNGIDIDGWQISGWLYWHLNHWLLKVDEQDAEDSINADILEIRPQLRDNDFIINTNLLRAEAEKKGLPIMGLRQFGKTSFEASYGGRAGVLFKNSQNLIMGTSVDDLNNITASMDFGLLNCSPYFRVPRITQDWTAERVLLGLKLSNNNNIVHSTYVIRNTAGGKKTEKGAGVSNLKCNLWDEIGKDKFLRALTATTPAMVGANGWRCIPILTGTGGNMTNAHDAKKLFKNPKTYKMLEFLQPDGSTTGLFMSGEYRSDCKYEMTVAEYLIQQGVITEVPKDSELWITKILVSDKEKARKLIKEELQSYLDAGDMENYYATKSYYPLEINDMFLSESNNKFPPEETRQHQKELLTNYEPLCVEFYRDKSNKPLWRTSDLSPIDKFPVGPTEMKDAPVIIYEEPEEGVPFGTYCVGIDPYNEDESSSKINSLGTIYVYKRMYNPMGKMQNCMVASWSGRKKEVKQFHQLALDICEYYNAIGSVNPENEDKTLIQFFQLKRKGHYLATTQELAVEIAQGKKIQNSRKVGLAATTINQRYGMNLIIADAKDEVTIVNENGEEDTMMGVYKIPDPMLLEEFLQYKGKDTGRGVHDGNFDRIIAWYHAIILARYYDVKYPVGVWKATPTQEEQNRKKQSSVMKTMFGTITKQHPHNNLFGNNSNKKTSWFPKPEKHT